VRLGATEMGWTACAASCSRLPVAERIDFEKV
jgi:hypothetical protein